MVGNLNTIRNEGYRVLARGLGAAATAIFLRQFENGSGNFTEERRVTLDDNTIDAIAARIKKRKET
jgi:hypothetical protein